MKCCSPHMGECSVRTFTYMDFNVVVICKCTFKCLSNEFNNMTPYLYEDTHKCFVKQIHLFIGITIDYFKYFKTAQYLTNCINIALNCFKS